MSGGARTARGRRGRVLIVGDIPELAHLAADDSSTGSSSGSSAGAGGAASTAPIRVSNLFEALGEISISTAAAPISTVLLSDRTANINAGRAVEALRRLDPSIRLILVCHARSSAAAAEWMQHGFDDCVLAPLGPAELARMFEDDVPPQLQLSNGSLGRDAAGDEVRASTSDDSPAGAATAPADQPARIAPADARGGRGISLDELRARLAAAERPLAETTAVLRAAAESHSMPIHHSKKPSGSPAKFDAPTQAPRPPIDPLPPGGPEPSPGPDPMPPVPVPDPTLAADLADEIRHTGRRAVRHEAHHEAGHALGRDASHDVEPAGAASSSRNSNSGGPLGDIDLVEAIITPPAASTPPGSTGGGELGRVALQLIAEQTGWTDIALTEPDQPAAKPSGATVEVAFGGQSFGNLTTAHTDVARLRPWAEWLARWLALDRSYQGHRSEALRDCLTGAWNRRFFDSFLQQAIDRAAKARRPVTVMVFDIDNFKTYNDDFGHAAGDEVLIETVRLLTSVIRQGDRVCRIGGDEFAVIFADPEGPRAAGSTHPESVEVIAQRFQAQICTMKFPKLGDQAPGPLTISAGLASFPWDGRDPQTLLDKADQLAMESKRRGKKAIAMGPAKGR